MSFNKNLVLSGFTLALLVASSYGDFPGAMASSYGGMAGDHCFEPTETKCSGANDKTRDENCRTTCLGKGDSYVGGYCDKLGSSSCVCIKKKNCAAELGPASA